MDNITKPATTTPATRRPGVLAVHSVHEFAWTVPNLEAARHFYTCFGLDVQGEGESLALYTHGHPKRWARIFQHGEIKRLQWISWGIFADDLERFDAHLNAKNVTRINPPPWAQDEDGIWFCGPDSMPQQLVVADKCSPNGKSPRVFPDEISLKGRAPQRSQVWQVRPRHLSHILTFCKNVPMGLAFYQDVLGLRLSDKSGAMIAFIHTPHGSDHHLIALAHSDNYGLHHSSWDVASLDDIGLGIDQMRAAGFEQGWGLGRHVLGSNYFRYVRDPWGSYAEYSFDIDYIPSDHDWPSADYPPEDSLYVWGPDLPEDFVRNYETAA